MPRYALKIEYNGGPFYGWQRQEALSTVQGEIEAAVLKLDATCTGIQGAGRTDTGVHATGQIAHVDLAAEWDPFRLSEALNFHLKPRPIAILDAALVHDGFHARFDALQRSYLFRLMIRRAPVTHEAGFVWQRKHPLDLDAMREGAAHLIGHHDFTTFRSTTCQAKSPEKTMDEITIEEIKTEHATELRFHITARSFLHNQVRSIVGTLERVGAGSWSPNDVKTALEARERTACGPVCTGEGLYLRRVTYATDPFA